MFRLATALTDSLVVLVTARGFGAAGRGLYTLTAFSAQVIIILIGGASIVMRAEVGRKRVPLGKLYMVCVALSGAALVLAAVVVPVVLLLWPDATVALCVAIASPFLLLSQLQMSLYQAQGDVRRMHYVGLARSVVPLLALALVSVLSPGHTRTALLVWAGVQVVTPLVTLAAQHRQAGLQWRGTRPLLARLIRRGIPVSVAEGVALLSARVDLVVIATVLSIADAGRYSIAIAAGEILALVARAVSTGAYAPMISSPLPESIRVTVRTLRHFLALLVPGGVVLVLAAAVGAGPLLGPDFSDVWVLVGLLLPGYVGASIGEALINFLVVRLERTREMLLIATGTGALNVCASVALISLLGLPGAAIATSASYGLAALLFLQHFARAGGPRRVRDYVPSSRELADYRALLRALRRRLLGGPARRRGAPDAR